MMMRKQVNILIFRGSLRLAIEQRELDVHIFLDGQYGRGLMIWKHTAGKTEGWIF